MDDRDESLLLRWSRRKHAARQEVKPAPAPQPTETQQEQASEISERETAPEPAAPAQEEAPAETVAVEDLPDIESLTYESDFSPFMREGVPEFLKKQALRKLWQSSPILANLDGLNDYDPKSMNFLIQDMEGAVDTVAEVGRGLRDKIMEAKRAREERPRGRRTPQRQRPDSSATPPQENQAAAQREQAGQTEQAAQDDGAARAPETKRYDA